jgi:hypothetical protein
MPSVQKVHVDKMLSNISIGYKNEAYVADQIFLPVVVAKQSDRYPVFGKEMFRVHEDKRAPGTEASEITWDLSSDQYFCEGHALRASVADEEVQNADEGFTLETDATEQVTGGILLNKEIDAAAKLLNSSNYDSALVFSMGGGGSNPAKWSDYTNSDPTLDIIKAKELIHKKSGIRPNVLIISETVLSILQRHPKILAILSNNDRKIADLQTIQLCLGVEKIIVGSGMKSTATNVGQPDVLTYIWGNSAVLCYVPATPGKKTLAIGYSFMWNKDGAGPVQVRKWYEIGRRTTLVEAERWYSQKIISNVAGFLFADAVTPVSG